MVNTLNFTNVQDFFYNYRNKILNKTIYLEVDI